MPEMSWQPGTNLRLTMAYGYSDKINIQGEPRETAKIHEVLCTSRISKAASFSLDASLRLSEIQFDGRTNTPVAYEMLEAQQPGTNLNWNFTLQKKLLQGLQLSAVYEGRKSEDRAAIHIGRIQVSALF